MAVVVVMGGKRWLGVRFREERQRDWATDLSSELRCCVARSV